MKCKKWKVCKHKIHGKAERHISLPNGDIYIYGGEEELKGIPNLIVKAVNKYLEGASTTYRPTQNQARGR